jgi:hypothetical protein
MYRGSTKVYVHHLDFQYNNFLHVFFIVQTFPLYVNFSIPLAENDFFSMFHTSCEYEILRACTQLT